jgi:MFS family permease
MLSPAAPFRAVLRQRNIRRLLAGLAISQAGDWLYNLALLAFVYDRTHSSTWVGLTTAARIVPLIVLGPLGGVLADRIDRRALMIGCDLMRAATMAALAAVVLVHAPIVLAPIMAALCTAAGAPYIPAVQAVLPRLAGADQLPAANAARVGLTHICVVAGPVFGALLLLLGSPAIAFALNGVTFVIGGIVVAGLPRDDLRVDTGGSRAGLISGLQAGWTALKGCADAGVLVGANMVASAIYGACTVLFVLVSHRLGLGSSGYGYLLGAAGAGGVLSAGLAQRAAAGTRPRRALTVAVLAIGAPLPLVAVTRWAPAALALVAIFGAGSIVAEVVADTQLQRSLDPGVVARAYGFVLPANLAGIAAGALLAPLCVSVAGLSGSLVLLGAAAIAYGALVVARPRTSHVRVGAGRPGPAANVGAGSR